jgi:type II secretory pathway pseudopilin PulG
VSASIVLLLAAIAVPRHARFSEDVRRQQVASLGVSVQSAARLAHSLWQASGEPLILKVSRGDVRMVRGYPVARDLKLLLEIPEGMAFREDHGVWQHTDLSRSEPCGVSYQPPAEAGSVPTIREHLSGC